METMEIEYFTTVTRLLKSNEQTNPTNIMYEDRAKKFFDGLSNRDVHISKHALGSLVHISVTLHPMK
jgi:hypothetical protein